MSNQETLEELEKALEELRQENKTVPIIVEGDKDITALRKLGFTGEIIRYNQGLSLADFCDMIAEHYDHVIILTDWDRRGGYLCHMIKSNIQSRVKCDLLFRAKIAKKATIKTVEGLPTWLETLREKSNHT